MPSADPFETLVESVRGTRLDPNKTWGHTRRKTAALTTLAKDAVDRGADGAALVSGVAPEQDQATQRTFDAPQESAARHPAEDVRSVPARMRGRPLQQPVHPGALGSPLGLMTALARNRPAPSQAPAQAPVQAPAQTPAQTPAQALRQVATQSAPRGATAPAPQTAGTAQASHAMPAQVMPRGLGGLGGLAASVVVREPSSAVVAYSDEQQAVIDCHSKHVVVDAFAGCGKTTTAVGFCQARPNQRILYLVLNTANAAEARTRFPANVSAMTTHSLAWNSPGMKAHVGKRIDRRWRAMTLMQQFQISTAAEAYHTQQVLQSFFASTDKEIGDKHVAAIAQERNLSRSHAMYALANAQLVWKAMCDRSGKCSIPDDAYLKLYALGAPQLPYDTVILDEAQDANPVTTQIIAAQQKSRLLCIGDRHQAIYQFRGSVNAMERFAIGADRFQLTQTYRFGPRIAEVANTILGDLKGETHKIQGMAQDGNWDPKRVTYLSRTNAQLFALAAERRGQGIYWVGKVGQDGYVVGRDGPDNYRLNLLADVYHLFARDVASVQDRSLRQMGSYDEYQRYGEAANDGEARVLCKLVETHGHDTLQLIEDIRQNACHRESEADIVVTTAHKAKGLEWGCVRVCDDFEFLQEIEETLQNEPLDALSPNRVQDINLLYVAATRAKQAVHLNDETTEWLANIENHREQRNAHRSAARSRELAARQVG